MMKVLIKTEKELESNKCITGNYYFPNERGSGKK